MRVKVEEMAHLLNESVTSSYLFCITGLVSPLRADTGIVVF